MLVRRCLSHSFIPYIFMAQNDHLAQFIASVRNDARVASYNPLQLKQSVVLKVLHLLGWDAFNASEVVPDYNAGGTTIDYTLQTPSGAIFLHVVNPLSERTLELQERIVKTAAASDVHLAILTDGLRWSLFVPMPHSSFRDKEFCKLDFTQDDPVEASSTLKKSIGHRIAVSGTAFSRAEKMFNERMKRKRQMLSTALTDAWSSIVREGDVLFSELLAVEVKRSAKQDIELSAAQSFYQSFTAIATTNDSAKRGKYENPDITVAQAWTGLLKQLHPMLTELMMDDIERLHQFRADYDAVDSFLQGVRRAHEYALRKQPA
jgi:hypothetical protein